MNQEDKVPKKPGSVFPSPLLRVDIKGQRPCAGDLLGVWGKAEIMEERKGT